MENSASLAHLLSLSFGLLCLWIALFYLYRDYCVDAFRQRVFALRDQLFDEAAEGLIDFDHPAYGLLRKTMNGYLRFGHKLTFTQTFILFFVTRKARKNLEARSFEHKLKRVSDTLPKEVRERVEFYHIQMHNLLIKHMLKSSPILLFIMVVMVCSVIPFLIFLAFKNWIYDRVKRFMAQPIGNLESTAYAYGGLK